MTLLSVCQDAIREIGQFEVPNTIVSNSNTTAIKLLAHAKRAVRELAERADWDVITREYTFATVNGTTAYSMPSDFDRFVSDTWWDTQGEERFVPVSLLHHRKGRYQGWCSCCCFHCL